jgi:hypothetical protein
LTPNHSSPKRRWRKVDLHIHTPASSDYHVQDVSYIDILRQAQSRSLDIIAFTDHNTVAGYRAMHNEIKDLELLERLNRLDDSEKGLLQEYRELLSKVLVLPGFEFTATFGFHILGIFSPDTPIRSIDHVLLNLNIPDADLDKGSSTVGASTDVLTAYKQITEAGGLTIAAHANSTHGIAMRGFKFGGQTKVAYTQDENLYALEVTDLSSTSRRSTARFFNGSKPEYPRRMHCIQGSDAHRLIQDTTNTSHLGVGDRITEMLLPEPNFNSLRDLLRSPNFSNTRPYRGTKREIDYVRSAQQEGASIIQSFHPRITKRGGHLFSVISDVCAMANTNGGVIFIGTSSDSTAAHIGITNLSRTLGTLKGELSRRITPSLNCSIDTLTSRGKKILRINVPRGDDPPYAIDDNKIFVRDEAETTAAVRDEIVQLTRLSHKTNKTHSELMTSEPDKKSKSPTTGPPKTGVEIVATEERDETKYHTMRDLRNGNQVKNVTRASSRRLWHYAIMQRETDLNMKNLKAEWQGNLGFIKHYKKGPISRTDLCQRTKDGRIRIYYGVTEDGLHGPWRKIANTSK